MIRLRYRLLSFAARLGIAYRYATRQMTQEDARELYYPVTSLAGWRPLITIDTDGIVDELREEYRDDPRFEEWADRAASRVASKWSDDGETRYAAIDWAMSLIKDYAEGDDTALVPLGDEQMQVAEA